MLMRRWESISIACSKQRLRDLLRCTAEERLLTMVQEGWNGSLSRLHIVNMSRWLTVAVDRGRQAFTINVVQTQCSHSLR